MKKWMYLFSVFFVMALAVLISENTASAQDRTDFNIQDGDLTNYAGTVANVEIPDDVVRIGAGVFKKHTEITSVVIPQGVTTIEKEAFSGCTSLQSVVLPDSVTYLGEKAFYGCKGLSNVTFSKNLGSISGSAFYNCSGLLSISIPGNCTSIGEYAFSGCNNVGNIELGYGIQDIDKYAFENNNKVISVTIPDSVTNMGSSVFSSCDNLQEVVLSKSLAIIPNSIFAYCKKITKLSVPEGVQSLGKGCVSGCSNLKYLAIPDTVTSVEKLNSFNATPNKNLIIYCNRDTAAYNYAVANNIFYKPLENYTSDSAGGSTDTNTGTDTGSSNGTTDTSNNTNTGSSNGTTDTSNNTNTGTTGNTSNNNGTSTTVTEVKVEEITCVNRKCIHVKFSNSEQAYIDVSQMKEGLNNISFEYGGKIYSNCIVNCTSAVLNVTSVKSTSDDTVVLTCSGQFAKDRNGSEIIPRFTVFGYTTTTTLKQQDGSIFLKISGTMYADFNYILEAEYPEGIINIQQNTFAGYKKAEETKTETSTVDTPSSRDPVEDNMSSGNSNTTNNNNNVVTDSGTGWDDDSYYEKEEPVVKNPKLSKKTKTIKKGKAFTLYVRNTTSNAKWKTGNKKIARIVYKSGGYVKIKALKKGRTNITAYVDGKILKCKIKVK